MKTRVIPEEVRLNTKSISDEGWFVVVGDISEEALESISYYLGSHGLEIVQGVTEDGEAVSGDYWLRFEEKQEQSNEMREYEVTFTITGSCIGSDVDLDEDGIRHILKGSFEGGEDAPFSPCDVSISDIKIELKVAYAEAQIQEVFKLLEEHGRAQILKVSQKLRDTTTQE